MSQAKYKEYYQKMISEDQDLFDSFKEIHDKFAQDKDRWRDKFNEVGRGAVEVVRDWERRLCSAMGKGVYSVYSQQLSEKFWDLVRKEYPLVDLVGVKVVKR